MEKIQGDVKCGFPPVLTEKTETLEEFVARGLQDGSVTVVRVHIDEGYKDVMDAMMDSSIEKLNSEE